MNTSFFDQYTKIHRKEERIDRSFYYKKKHNFPLHPPPSSKQHVHQSAQPPLRLRKNQQIRIQQEQIQQHYHFIHSCHCEQQGPPSQPPPLPPPAKEHPPSSR
ncbi:hypothetical protein OIU79_016619 [Salix purpurea]|uniref:Uncharacterized protein n=1 Tax=Salix purpurea TaxID=77065 RepID=A0A9Q0SRE2_SALPP|nr:hypothetical protein OIU79_016619 [Salix purpurea]